MASIMLSNIAAAGVFDDGRCRLSWRRAARAHSWTRLLASREQVLEMDFMSRESLGQYIYENNGLTEPEAAGMLRNLLLAVSLGLSPPTAATASGLPPGSAEALVLGRTCAGSLFEPGRPTLVFVELWPYESWAVACLRGAVAVEAAKAWFGN